MIETPETEEQKMAEFLAGIDDITKTANALNGKLRDIAAFTSPSFARTKIDVCIKRVEATVLSLQERSPRAKLLQERMAKYITDPKILAEMESVIDRAETTHEKHAGTKKGDEN